MLQDEGPQNRHPGMRSRVIQAPNQAPENLTWGPEVYEENLLWAFWSPEAYIPNPKSQVHNPKPFGLCRSLGRMFQDILAVALN